MSLQKQFYFLSPIEAVKVTSQNMEEVAEWCGGRVAQTESRRRPGTMDSYVWVPTPKGTAISWAFPGMYITKRVVLSMKDEVKTTYAVFRRDYFQKNYFETPTLAVDATWGRNEKKSKKGKGVEPKQISIDELDAMADKVLAGKKTVNQVRENAGFTELVKEAVKEALEEKVFDQVINVYNEEAKVLEEIADRAEAARTEIEKPKLTGNIVHHLPTDLQKLAEVPAGEDRQA